MTVNLPDDFSKKEAPAICSVCSLADAALNEKSTLKPHKRLMAALEQIKMNQPLYLRAAFEAWLKSRPGNVRHAPLEEQLRQFRAQTAVSKPEVPT